MKEVAIIMLAVSLGGLLLVIGYSPAKAESECDLSCLNDKILALTRRVTALEKNTGTTKTVSAKIKESFFRIGEGSGTGTDWTKVAGSDFWFDQSLYPGVVEVSWQGWMDNGDGWARLYDATNSRGVDGSEVSISGGTKASFYSKPLSIWRGQNQYYIQIKNINAQTVTISSPRLRILTK